MQYVNISIHGPFGFRGGYTTDEFNDISELKGLLSELSEGEWIKLLPVELTEAEFEALPEFEGFLNV